MRTILKVGIISLSILYIVGSIIIFFLWINNLSSDISISEAIKDGSTYIVTVISLYLASITIHFAIRNRKLGNLVNDIRSQIGRQLGLDQYIENVCRLYEAAGEFDGKIDRVVTHVTQWRYGTHVIKNSLYKSKAKEVILIGNLCHEEFLAGVIWRIMTVVKANKTRKRAKLKPIKIYHLPGERKLPAFAVTKVKMKYRNKIPQLYVANPKAAYEKVTDIREGLFGHEFPPDQELYIASHNELFDKLFTEDQLNDPNYILLNNFLRPHLTSATEAGTPFVHFKKELTKKCVKLLKSSSPSNEELVNDYIEELFTFGLLKPLGDSCPKVELFQSENEFVNYLKDKEDVGKSKYLIVSITNKM